MLLLLPASEFPLEKLTNNFEVLQMRFTFINTKRGRSKSRLASCLEESESDSQTTKHLTMAAFGLGI